MLRAWDVWPHLEPFATAFRTLSAGRDWMGGGLGGKTFPQRIAESEKTAYADGRGIVLGSAAYLRFVALLDAQDEEFVKYHTERVRATTPDASDVDGPAGVAADEADVDDE